MSDLERDVREHALREALQRLLEVRHGGSSAADLAETVAAHEHAHNVLLVTQSSVQPFPMNRAQVNAANRLIEEHCPAAPATTDIQIALGDVDRWLESNGKYPRRPDAADERRLAYRLVLENVRKDVVDGWYSFNKQEYDTLLYLLERISVRILG